MSAVLRDDGRARKRDIDSGFGLRSRRSGSGARCTRLGCSSERSGLEPGDDRRSFGITAMCRPCVASARRWLGSSRTERDGCGTERVARNAVFFGNLAACGGSIDSSRGCRWSEGPRRGTKPREGQDAEPSGNVRSRVRTRRRSNAPKSTLRAGGAPRCTSATAGTGGSGQRGRERQGGNGHGDVVRLLARNSSRGMKRAARTTFSPPTERTACRSSGLGDGGV
jgi:hypothetical protein